MQSCGTAVGIAATEPCGVNAECSFAGLAEMLPGEGGQCKGRLGLKC